MLWSMRAKRRQQSSFSYHSTKALASGLSVPGKILEMEDEGCIAGVGNQT